MSTKKWIDFDVDFLIPAKPSKQVPKKTSTTTKRIAKYINKDLNYEKRLQPTCVEDLAVHNKKIAEVNEWLQQQIINRRKTTEPPILLITGPTGCGKSVTVKTLCKKEKIEISEWLNPMDLDYESYRRQSDQFQEFLFETKYKSLFATVQNKVTVIKDIPNIFIKEPTEFIAILEQYYYGSNGPVIFICTDVASQNINIAQKLFPDELRLKLHIENISFNSTADSLVKAALKRVELIIQENLELFKIPTAETLESIIASSNGDLRCATNQYYFASLKGTNNLPTEFDLNEQQTVGKRKRKKELGKVKQMAKTEVLGLFHSIGRVLNPKRRELNNSWRINCDFNHLIDELSTFPTTALGFLQENYPKHLGSSNDLACGAELLSASQCLVAKWYENYTDNVHEGLWLCVLGLMVVNQHKVTGWNPIRGPKKIDLKLKERHKLPLPKTDLCYYNLINKTNKFDRIRFN